MKYGALLFIAIGLITISSCMPAEPTGIPPDIVAAVEQTQTAAIWTVTPSATVVPSTAVIINTLNNAIRGQDILAEVVDAEYYIIDLDFGSSGNPPIISSIQIDMECESLNRSRCTTERAFVLLMHALEKEKVRKEIFSQIPTTIQELFLHTFDHMQPIGLITAKWSDVMGYAEGNITAEQLGARISHP